MTWPGLCQTSKKPVTSTTYQTKHIININHVTSDKELVTSSYVSVDSAQKVKKIDNAFHRNATQRNANQLDLYVDQSLDVSQNMVIKRSRKAKRNIDSIYEAPNIIISLRECQQLIHQTILPPTIFTHSKTDISKISTPISTKEQPDI